jgi:uncharacterized protein (TIGR00369 family)
MSGVPADAPIGGFDALAGVVLTEVTAERVTGSVAVRDDLRGPSGALHGAIFTGLAESAAIVGTKLGVSGSRQRRVRPISTVTSALRPVLEGTVRADAVRRHAGRTTWVWEVELADDAGRPCAAARVTVAVDED